MGRIHDASAYILENGVSLGSSTVCLLSVLQSPPVLCLLLVNAKVQILLVCIHVCYDTEVPSRLRQAVASCVPESHLCGVVVLFSFVCSFFVCMFLVYSL